MPSFGTILRTYGPVFGVAFVPFISLVYAAITLHAHAIDDATRDPELCGDWSWVWTTNRMIQLIGISMIGLAFSNAVMIKYLGKAWPDTSKATRTSSRRLSFPITTDTSTSRTLVGIPISSAHARSPNWECYSHCV